MDNKINGRTPEEIKNGLECCSYSLDYCDKCPYNGMPCNDLELNRDALALVQQLERERDAAVEQLKEVDRVDLFRCSHCAHDELCNDGLTSCIDCDKDCPCRTCEKGGNWQWRGVEVE